MPIMKSSTRTLKRFGQHWLRDPQILDRIVAAAELERAEVVLEIGPGQGSLTARLLKSNPVVAVEIDRRLIAELHQQFDPEPGFRLIEGDVLALPLPEDATAVVANIPYNISGPILAKLCGEVSAPLTQFRSIVLLLQKELAERICASEGNRTYGALSVRLQYLARCELLFAVSRHAFSPPPDVESAVIRLTPRPYPQQADSIAHFEQLLIRAFATRRKMLRNCLKGWVEPEVLQSAFTALQLRLDARAEDLSVEQFVRLSNGLSAASGPTASTLQQ